MQNARRSLLLYIR